MQPYDWTGFYFGANVGYGRSKTDGTTINTATGAVDAFVSGTTSNFHEGGQLGFDYMTGSRFVIGILADAATGDDNIVNLVNAAGTAMHSEEFKNVAGGTVRGRIGYALYNVLLYGTGGWAWTAGSVVRTQVIGKAGTATPGYRRVGSREPDRLDRGGRARVRVLAQLGSVRRISLHELSIQQYRVSDRAASLTSTTAANSIAVGLNFKFNPIFARY